MYIIFTSKSTSELIDPGTYVDIITPPSLTNNTLLDTVNKQIEKEIKNNKKFPTGMTLPPIETTDFTPIDLPTTTTPAGSPVAASSTLLSPSLSDIELDEGSILF